MKRRHPPIMTAAEYKAARKRIGLSNYALARKIGINLRTAQRYEAGRRRIPAPIARLLECWARHGLPD